MAYSIRDAAQLLAVHPQTLRTWERAGLIKPQRLRGNRRLYSEADMEQLRYIVHLWRAEGLRVTDIKRVLQLEGKLDGNA